MSGNVMTTKYGAAVYLSTVVTDAVLKKRSSASTRYFIDRYCKKCLICDKACPAKMFEMEKEEYVLLNSELHPRGNAGVSICATLPASASTVCPLIKNFPAGAATGSVPGWEGSRIRRKRTSGRSFL